MTTELEYFWSHTMYAGDCIVWTGAMKKTGYGHFCWRGKIYYAHRKAYELLVGPIPKHLQIDHLCRNPSCVNVAHLRLVTPRENVFAAGSRVASNLNRLKTHCKYGHELAVIKNQRYCRECHRQHQQEYVKRNKQQGGIYHGVQN